MNWFIDAFKNALNFSGRSSRKAYWMFFLFCMIGGFVVGLIDGVLGTTVLSGLYGLVIFLPSLALTVRRLHDTDRSGWWCLIGLVPILGGLALLVLMILEGTHGDNRFGADPRALLPHS